MRYSTVTVSTTSKAPTAIAPPLSITDLVAMMERLPASVRAELAWSPTALRSQLQPLLQGPLTPEVVEAAAGGVLEILGRILPAISKGLTDFSTALNDAQESEISRLLNVLPDSGSKRSAGWVMRVLQSLTSSVVGDAALIESLDVREAVHGASAQIATHEAGWPLGSMVLLMAAIVIADEGGDSERAAELCDLAFLNASKAVDYLARSEAPFTSQPAIRASGRDVLQIFEEARTALGPDDIETLSRARLRDLR